MRFVGLGPCKHVGREEECKIECLGRGYIWRNEVPEEANNSTVDKEYAFDKKKGTSSSEKKWV